MENMFSSSKQNISSLLLWDAPPNEIASITDVRRSNTYEYKRIFKLYSKNFKGCQLSELSSADQRRTHGEIIEVRVDNAVHAVQFISITSFIYLTAHICLEISQKTWHEDLNTSQEASVQGLS